MTLPPPSSPLGPRKLAFVVLFIGVAAASYVALQRWQHRAPASQPVLDRWRPYTAPNGSFTVQFPGAATATTRPLQSGAAQHLVGLDLPDGTGFGVFYIVGVTTTEPERGLDELIATQAKRDTMLSSGKISLSGNPGRESRWRTADGRILIERTYIARGQIYTLTVRVIADRENARAGDFQTFFDSFRFTFTP